MASTRRSRPDAAASRPWWRRGPLISLAASVVALSVLAAFAGWQMAQPTPKVSTSGSALSALGQGIGDVRLTDSTGAAVRWGDLTGKPRAVFFGFTHCPEICPTTLNELQAAIAQTGPKAADLKVQFVTVDPARDTPKALHDYLEWIGPVARGYTGAPDQIAKLAAGFRVVYRRTELEGGDYTMDHTTLVYLIDASGIVRDVIVYGSGPDRAAAQIRAFLDGEGPAGRVVR